MEQEKLKTLFDDFCKKNGIEDYDNYSFRDDIEISELRWIRDKIYEEANRYQELINKKILDKTDVAKYQDQYIRYFNSNKDLAYLHVHQLNRLSTSVNMIGSGIEVSPDTSVYINKLTLNIPYSCCSDYIEIITEEEYKKEIRKIVENALKNLKIV